jgi:hypothetical protein
MQKERMSKHLKKILKESYPIEISTEDLSKDPVFAAKHEKAEKLIAEFGIPEAFKTKPKKAKSVRRKV